MKLSLILFMLSMMPFFGTAVDIDSFLINGVIEHVDAQERSVTLSIYDPITQSSKEIARTEASSDGTFKLEYNWDGPELYLIKFPKRQSAFLAVDSGQKRLDISVEGKRNGYVKIEGSPDSNLLLAYDAFKNESNARLIKPAYRAINEAKRTGNVEAEVDAVRIYVENSKIHRAELLDFTEQKIKTSIALYGTVLRWTGDEEVNRLESLVNDFAKAHPNLPMTKKMIEKVNRYKKVAIGAAAPPISSKNEEGELVNLRNYLGKYTLIDFWASWCGPCISQLPDLHEAYDSFADRGFEIVSVSVDRSESKWLSAIEKHEMDWKHISDVAGWNSKLAKDYNVTFVPFNLLVDEQGTIIYKNLHSKVLQSTLESLFSEDAK